MGIAQFPPSRLHPHITYRTNRGNGARRGEHRDCEAHHKFSAAYSSWRCSSNIRSSSNFNITATAEKALVREWHFTPYILVQSRHTFDGGGGGKNVGGSAVSQVACWGRGGERGGVVPRGGGMIQGLGSSSRCFFSHVEGTFSIHSRSTTFGRRGNRNMPHVNISIEGGQELEPTVLHFSYNMPEPLRVTGSQRITYICISDMLLIMYAYLTP